MHSEPTACVALQGTASPTYHAGRMLEDVNDSVEWALSDVQTSIWKYVIVFMRMLDHILVEALVWRCAIFPVQLLSTFGMQQWQFID